jgi:hypothetical protein
MCHKIKYSSLKETEFFEFFNLCEIGTDKYGVNDNLKRIFLKTGGFQDHINIEFHILKDEIVNAFLHLDREWIGNINSINPFAKDIAKSFLNDLIPLEINPEFKRELVHFIWNLEGDQDTIIRINEVEREFEKASSDVKQFLDTFLGERNLVHITFDNFTIMMENHVEHGTNKNHLLITLSWIK